MNKIKILMIDNVDVYQFSTKVFLFYMEPVATCAAMLTSRDSHANGHVASSDDSKNC